MDSLSLKDLIELIIAVVALIISIIALYYTVTTFHLKRGQFLRYTFSRTSTVESQDCYISNITIENLKDKSSVIFQIYLQIGHNILMELDNFEGNPLVLDPYSIYSKSYDPIIYYDCGVREVKLNSILESNKLRDRMRIVLATSEGKVYPKSNRKLWSATSQFFDNFYLAIIRPIRLNYKGKSYGSNVKYLVDLEFRNGENYVVPIMNTKTQLYNFKDLNIGDCLNMNTKEVRNFFNEQRKKKVLDWKKIIVIDFESEIKKSKELLHGDQEKIVPLSFFQYFILGRIYTLLDKFKENRQNRKLLRKNRKVRGN
ncbi:hypothetical protein BWD42_13690 [Sphingobacterium sp. CZ-UAM]|uniref:hypothetical protein n=1 Tax=Sphingobacterium sp. CZ-UAM TaxID=1933868 RepID=UPI000984EE89|nr:hypothetical protein [Sphingobacterium sp. CZ-UAM]OOG18304.1 hypothetical protein BWD42_13690 [Sphingobacterium sp. CZ-UAM]